MPRFLPFILIGFWAAPLFAQETSGISYRQMELPGKVEQVTRAGGGDYLLLHLNKLALIAVFDVQKEEISGYIPTGGDVPLVAGTASKIIVLLPDQGILQRWSLDPLEKQLTVAVPVPDKVHSLAAGYAGEGPLMLTTAKNRHLIDTKSLKEMNLRTVNRRDDWLGFHDEALFASPSADGLSFVVWSIRGHGLELIRLVGDVLVREVYRNEDWHVGLNRDGSLVSSNRAMYSWGNRLEIVEEFETHRHDIRDYRLFTPHPSYYVGLTIQGDRLSEGELDISAILHSTLDLSVVVKLSKLPGISPVGRLGPPHLFPYKDRLFVDPAAKKIIIFDDRRDRVHIGKFDVADLLEAKGIDYLLVDSYPTRKAIPGQKYTYPLKVLSRTGEVQVQLTSGPEGMELAAGNELQWDVPAGRNPTEPVEVALVIRDKSGQEVDHAFAIHLQVTEVVEPNTSQRTGDRAPEIFMPSDAPGVDLPPINLDALEFDEFEP